MVLATRPGGCSYDDDDEMRRRLDDAEIRLRGLAREGGPEFERVLIYESWEVLQRSRAIGGILLGVSGFARQEILSEVGYRLLKYVAAVRRHLTRVSPDSQPAIRPYMLRTVRRVVYDHISGKLNGARRSVPLGDQVFQLESRKPDTTRFACFRLLRSLDRVTQKILLLHLKHGLAHRVIAERLGLTENVERKRYSRGIRQLRTILNVA